MANLTFSQLEGYWIAAGGNPGLAPVMAAIGLAESGGNPDATNPTDNGGTQTSWGIWQISNGNHNEPAANWNDPLENAKLAVGKVQSQGLTAWGTYDSGAYKRFLQNGVAPTTPTGSSTSGSAPTSTGSIQPADAVSSVGNFLQILGQATADIMQGILWLLRPSSWVRIFAGIIGTGFGVTGIVFFMKSA